MIYLELVSCGEVKKYVRDQYSVECKVVTIWEPEPTQYVYLIAEPTAEYTAIQYSPTAEFWILPSLALSGFPASGARI